MRDSQRKRVYDAEAGLLSTSGILFKDIEEVQRYVDRVCASKWWHKNAAHPNQHIDITQRRGYGGTAWGAHRIELGKHALKQTLVLHEMAHCGAPAGAHHNWQFCDFYLRLVRRFLGRKAWIALRSAFKWHKVKVRGPRKIIKLEVSNV